SIMCTRPPPSLPLCPYTTLFRSLAQAGGLLVVARKADGFLRGVNMRDLRAGLCANKRSEASIAEQVQHFRLRAAMRFQIVARVRSEEHTSELQSRENLVCRLLLE